MFDIKPKARNESNLSAVSLKEYAYHEDCNYNNRQSMEDDHFIVDDFLEDEVAGIFGVLDGHGGGEVVKFCTQSIPETFIKIYKDYQNNVEKLFQIVFNKVDDQLKLVGASDSGCTACVAFVRKEKDGQKLYLANVGDARAVLSSNGVAERLSVDHKASDLKEAQRVKESGGFILKNRVSGQLMVTRALGDLELKKEGVSNVPDVKCVKVTDKEKFVIMASDGLWDVIEDQAAVDLVKGLKNSDEMSAALLKYALTNGSKDNVSVLVLRLN